MRICSAARIPSSVPVGGIRISVMTTSGFCASTAAIRLSRSCAEESNALAATVGAYRPASRSFALPLAAEEKTEVVDHAGRRLLSYRLQQ